MLVAIAFLALGVVAALAGAAVFTVSSMARATYALALSFVAVGLQVVMLSQNFVGVMILLMMMMEMAVMAVFMVMFMGMNPALMPMSMVHGKRASLGTAGSVCAAMVLGIVLTPWPARRGAPPPELTAAIGRELLESKMLAMATISPVMVATIVGGVALALRRTRYDRYGDDLERPADDPQPGGVGR